MSRSKVYLCEAAARCTSQARFTVSSTQINLPTCCSSSRLHRPGNMSLRNPSPQAVTYYPWISGQWCCGRGHLLLLSLLPSQAGWRLRWWLQSRVISVPSFSIVWRGQAEREQQQAKQLEQQLRETQGSTQTLEQQASLMHASHEGDKENPPVSAPIGSICQHI